jgi:replicative superfamily II helicase
MVDFSKRKIQKEGEIKINPLEIYEGLDRKTDKGPLREIQKEILQKWLSGYKDKKDVILKLHTGQGKTLIGLLILQSKINQGQAPALYLCPNKYLVKQTAEQAESFGFRYCLIDETNELPEDFINGKSILITTVNKLFNGKSKFGLKASSIEVNSIILDDAHACLEKIKSAFKITVKNDHQLYKAMIELFRDDLKKQQAGTLHDIEAGDYDALLKVPYWSWQNKSEEVLTIVSKFATDKEVLFAWNLIKNILPECFCIISGSGLEIAPYFIPFEYFNSYRNASHRVFMSATINDDSFFIKGLGLTPDTIKDPLIVENEKWSGEKLILLPSLIDDTLDRTEVVNYFAKPRKEAKYGIVAIVPSFNNTGDFKGCGATIPQNDDFIREIEKFKSGNYNNTLVLTNRYDGIDLPDETCRILLICSLPFGGNLEERYIEGCRSSSEEVLLRTAQLIEQGFGRGVRGEKDYCSIVLVGPDLISLIKSTKTLKYFSAQTQKQIELGISVSKMVEEDIKKGEPPMKAFLNVINQQLDRNPDWKEYYAEEMDKTKNIPKKNNLLEILHRERKAYEAYKTGKIDSAADILQSIINDFEVNDEDKGWYLQEMARYLHAESIEQSNKQQHAAYNLNYNLFKPFMGFEPKKINLSSISRSENINSFIKKFSTYTDLKLHVENLLTTLSYESSSEVFEKSLEELGKIIGFESLRPEKVNNEGPDNLWQIDKNKYIVFECKNRVDPNRSYIVKSETGQMNNSMGWFNTTYPHGTPHFVMVYPKQNKLDKGAFLNLPCQVIRKKNLEKLKKNVSNFFKEFKKENLQAITNEIISSRLELHMLSDKNICMDYFELILN